MGIDEKMGKRLKCPKCGSKNTRFHQHSFRHLKEAIQSDQFYRLSEYEGEWASDLSKEYAHRIHQCNDCGHFWDRTQQLAEENP